MRYVIKSCCILTCLLLISCSSDLDKLEHTHSVQFYTDVSNVIIPDTTYQKQIFRFKPKISSDKFSIAINFISKNGVYNYNRFIEELEITVTDYDGNSISRQIVSHINSESRVSSEITRVRYFFGDYSLHSDKFYRVEIIIPSIDPIMASDSLEIDVGVIKTTVN